MNRTQMVGGTGKSRVREPAVAGLFYPDDPQALRAEVEQLLTARTEVADAQDRALIAPHAGYIYSGGVTADAYSRLRRRRDEIRRVVLIGPSHRVYLQGVAISPADAFATPLGDVEIDRELRARLLAGGNVLSAEAPHAMEHSLEVHLPFLQLTLNDFTLVPLVVGVATPRSIADALLELWDVEDTIFIASSDLSHYLSYDEARRVDAATNEQILRRDPSLGFEQACGALPINALLTVARDRDLNVQEISRLNSGDTAGDRERVVGYAAYAFH
jgi:AmmeMemoRadiSam system protein B